MISRILQTSLAIAVLSFPTAVNADSVLIPKVESSYCKGNLTLNLVKAECEDGCTWGSTIYLSGQVNATSDFPSSPEIKVKPTLPLMPFSGFYSVYYAMPNICTSLSAPAGNDAGYSCPSEGLYNFATNYQIWGKSHAWYGNIYGVNMGVDLDVYDAYTNEKWATCFMTVKIHQGEDGSSSFTNSAAFIGGATAVMSGLAAGLMYKRRRVMTERELSASSDWPQDGQSATNYELTVV